MRGESRTQQKVADRHVMICAGMRVDVERRIAGTRFFIFIKFIIFAARAAHYAQGSVGYAGVYEARRVAHRHVKDVSAEIDG